MVEALDMIAKGTLNPAGMITHVGGLNAVVQLLQKEGISLEYLYAYISKSVDASVIFYVKDCARAEEVLRKNGIRLLSEAY